MSDESTERLPGERKFSTVLMGSCATACVFLFVFIARVKGAEHAGLVEFSLWLLRTGRLGWGCTTFDVLVVDASMAGSLRWPMRSDSGTGESGFSLMSIRRVGLMGCRR